MFRWVLNTQTRDAMMKSGQSSQYFGKTIIYYYYYYYYLEVPDYFIELLNDKNEDIHKIASEIVNVLTVSKSIIHVLYCTLT